jgi:hypothetical protein
MPNMLRHHGSPNAFWKSSEIARLLDPIATAGRATKAEPTDCRRSSPL